MIKYFEEISPHATSPAKGLFDVGGNTRVVGVRDKTKHENVSGLLISSRSSGLLQGVRGRARESMEDDQPHI